MKLSANLSSIERNGQLLNWRATQVLVVCVLAHLATWPTRTQAYVSSNSNQQQHQVSKIGQVPASTEATAPTIVNNQAIKQQRDEFSECQYEKSPWSECQANGEQTRTLRLISGQRSGAPGDKCPRTKLVRRECKQGCKYIRGDWSPGCVDGQRVRIDKLVGRVDSPSKQQQPLKINCELQRKVTKDCRRACHYVKSAWSECVNGFKTRELRLEELPAAPSTLASSQCAKHRQIKRECNLTAAAKIHEANKLAARPITTTTSTSTSTATSTATSTQQSTSQMQQPKEHPSKMTLAQKRRLKQLQRQQKQQQQQQQQQQQPQSNNKSI